MVSKSMCSRKLCQLALGLLLIALWGFSQTDLYAQSKSLNLDAFALPEIPGEDHVTYTAEYSMDADAKHGQLRVTAKIDDDWHTYSTTQPPGGPMPTKISLDKKMAKVSGKIVSDKAPHIGQEDVYPGVPIEEFEHRVTWTVPFEKIGDWDPASAKFEVAIDGLVCMEGTCMPVEAKIAARFVDQAKLDAATPLFTSEKTHASARVYLENSEVKPGDQTNLVVELIPSKGYHVYIVEAESRTRDFRTLIIPSRKGHLLFGAPTTTAPTTKASIGAEEFEYHSVPVAWRIPVRVPSMTPVGDIDLEVLVGFTTCSDQTCDEPMGLIASGRMKVVSEAGSSERGPFDIKETPHKTVMGHPDLGQWVDFKDEIKQELAEKEVEIAQAGTLSAYTLMAALLGGFILNFMPCVLPVIGLKVLGFVEQAGSSRAEVVKLNLVYVLGILSVMWALAGITVATKNAFGWGEQFTMFEFKLAMAALVFAMALSFLGVWEIPIPGFATSYKSNQLMQREGVVGAYSKGLLTTILATPCSGPFLGFVFAVTLTLDPVGVFIIYSMVGLGMGLPFLVLCFRPSLVKALPKPGAWMETLKEALAFPLLLTVVYFTASIDTDRRIATLSTLIAVWFGCWLIGKVPAYADWNLKVKAWASAITVGVVWGMLSFTYLGPSSSELPWQPYSPERLATLREQGKTVMVDFTANWCINCQMNTKLSIEKPRIASLIEKNDIVPLLADWTDRSELIREQLRRLGSKSIPLLAIYPADPNAEPIILRDTFTESTLLKALNEAGPSQSSDSPTQIAITSDGPPPR